MIKRYIIYFRNSKEEYKDKRNLNSFTGIFSSSQTTESDVVAVHGAETFSDTSTRLYSKAGVHPPQELLGLFMAMINHHLCSHAYH